MLRMVFILVLAYLIGSIPNALWVSKQVKGIDPRQVGDGNLGSKNVFLHVGAAAGILVFCFDILKSYLPMLFFRAMGVDTYGLFAVGAALVIGHNWSIFTHFRGGQGMAVIIGIYLSFAPIPTLVATLIFLGLYVGLRHWDLACAFGYLAVPAQIWVFQGDYVLALYCIGVLPLVGLSKLWQRLYGEKINLANGTGVDPLGEDVKPKK